MTFGAAEFQVDVKNGSGGKVGMNMATYMIQKEEKKNKKKKKTIWENSGGTHDFKP